MIDSTNEPGNTPESYMDPAEASEASIDMKSISNASEAASDASSTPQGSFNPDDLHDLFAGAPAGEGSDEEDPLAQLRNDPNYAALIRDLEYIASQARLLFAPAEEAPSDELWSKIQSQLPARSGDEPEI